jgi:hypothetical protein
LPASAVEVDALTVQPFEGVLEHQQLRLDVGASPPGPGVQPGPVNLEAALLGRSAVSRTLPEPAVEPSAVGHVTEIPAAQRVA